MIEILIIFLSFFSLSSFALGFNEGFKYKHGPFPDYKRWYKKREISFQNQHISLLKNRFQELARFYRETPNKNDYEWGCLDGIEKCCLLIARLSYSSQK